MNLHQMTCDDNTLLGPDKTNEMALSSAGATHRCRSPKICFCKTWNEGEKLGMYSTLAQKNQSGMLMSIYLIY